MELISVSAKVFSYEMAMEDRKCEIKVLAKKKDGLARLHTAEGGMRWGSFEIACRGSDNICL